MNRLKLVGLTMFTLALTGCESLSIIASSKIEPSSEDSDWSAVMPVKSSKVWYALFSKDNTPDAFRSHCLSEEDIQAVDHPVSGEVSVMLGPVGGAALAALGGAAWGLGVDAVNSKVDKIQERSSNTWNATWTTTAKALKEAKCLALVKYRYTTIVDAENNVKNVSDPQMVLLIRVVEFDPKKEGLTAVQFVPLLVGSKTSSALTKDEGGGLGKIGLSAAGAISYFVDGVLKDSTPEVISVSGIKVGDSTNKPAQMYKVVGTASGGGYSGSTTTKPVSFPFTPAATTPLYIKFAVAETGTLSGKDAKAKAEIKVITDALGPVAENALKKRFETDESQ